MVNKIWIFESSSLFDKMLIKESNENTVNVAKCCHMGSRDLDNTILLIILCDLGKYSIIVFSIIDKTWTRSWWNKEVLKR